MSKKAREFIDAGKRVLYSTPFNTRVTGSIKFPAQNDEYVLVMPDSGGFLDMVHQSEIISVL